ncbi:unnamed protein product [Fusarium graminearum]|nr:unnamed protein product [Fusarium graminearum]
MTFHNISPRLRAIAPTYNRESERDRHYYSEPPSDHVIDLAGEDPPATPMPGSCQRDNDSHRQDLYVRHELAVAAVEANPDLALTGDYFLEHPYVISERRGPSRVCRFTDLTRKENEALILIMTEGIQAIYPGKTPTIKDWHDFVRGVFGGWTSMSVAPRHPVLREPRFDETHIEVGKLTTNAPSETNSTARRAGAPVFLGVSLNYEQGQGSDSGARMVPRLLKNRQTKFVFEIYDVLLRAQAEIEPIPAFEKNASEYLQRSLTNNELSELLDILQADDEDASYRLVAEVLVAIPPLLKYPNEQTTTNQQSPELLWLSATSIGLQIPYLDSKYQLLAARAPVSNTDDNNGSPVAVEVPINVIVPQPEELIQGFFDRLTRPENALDVLVKMDVSLKPIKAESLAVNSLHHPPSANPPPAMKSVEVYQYLMDFTPREDVVNLLYELPGINDVVQGGGLDHLVTVLGKMNKEMQQAVLNMKSTNAGVHFVPSVAGWQVLLTRTPLPLCLLWHSPSIRYRQGRGAVQLKGVASLDNNIGLEAFYERLSETFQRLGIDEARHFPIIRFYAVDGEVGSGYSGGFLRNAKHRHNEGSLCSGAFNYFEDNTDKFTQLHELVNKVKDGQELDTAEFGNFKAWVKNLFEAYLLQFNGVVLSTTTAASNFLFRTAFAPELVLVDEASTMRELTTMIPIAFFNPKGWIITGDVNQRAPFIIMEHDLQSGISSNPFAEQLNTSLLTRAVNAGVPKSYLKVNQTSGYQRNWPLRP